MKAKKLGLTEHLKVQKQKFVEMKIKPKKKESYILLLLGERSEPHTGVFNRDFA